MSLEQAIAENTQAIHQLIAVMTANSKAPATKQETKPAAKPEPKPVAKAEPKAEPQPEPEVKAEEPTTENVSVVSKDEVLKSAMTLAKSDREGLVALLNEFNAKKVSDLTADQYDAFNARIEEELKKVPY